jgi:hypothetical protein
MAYEIEINTGARVAHVVTGGPTNAVEGHALLVELAAHPDFEPGFGVIWDVRASRYDEATEDMMEGFRNIVRFRPLLRSRMAIVVGPEMELVSELSAALYETEGFETQVFWELDQAREWVKQGCAPDSAA